MKNQASIHHLFRFETCSVFTVILVIGYFVSQNLKPVWLRNAIYALVGFAILCITIYHFYVDITNRRPLVWFKAKLGLGKNVRELARRLDVSVEDLRSFFPSYTKTSIPKRSGGMRLLCMPDAETKKMQRRILRRLLQRLRAHSAAHGFEKGRSIVTHAKQHVGRLVVIRVDIVDFFPNTDAKRVQRYFRRIGWNRESSKILTRLTTWEGGLPQGAPTSPRLSNLVNFLLDGQLMHLARRRNAVYSRYADDITFSFIYDKAKRIRGTIQKIRRRLKAKGYRMHPRKKLHIRRRHQRQEVTGLIVNEKVQLPRKTRRWLRAVIHHRENGKEATLTDQQLQGWLAYVNMIETQRTRDLTS